MPTGRTAPDTYFVFGFPLSGQSWRDYAVREVLPDQVPADPDLLSFEIRTFADNVNRSPRRKATGGGAVPAEILLALRTVNQALRHVATRYFSVENPGGLGRCRAWARAHLGPENTNQLLHTFCDLFPPLPVALEETNADQYLSTAADHAVLEMMLLFVNVTNPATGQAASLFDDNELRRRSSYAAFVTGLEEYLDTSEPAGSEGRTIFSLLRAPALASPGSLAGQLAWIRANWAHLLPEEFLRRLQAAIDILTEIDLARAAQYGPPPVLEFGPGSPGWRADEPEPEAFSQDADWMPNVVLMAKSVYVWLDQLSRWHGRAITRLNEIPDRELDRLAAWGVNGLWLIGLWQRSEASRRIKQEMGNPDAAASAYALHDYRIADDLGGEDAWRDLSERAGRRGIRLASDMVPNHMGLDSRWIIEHPEYFLQLDHPPYPAYRFGGPDLCGHHDVSVRIEDGYWTHSDASVVFQRVDNRSGETRYIYHGNDGTSMPWNDTAQLNFLLPEVREAVTRVILDVARRFPIIRFDAAMTLAKKHYQRLWFPAPGDAGAIPSRAEHGLTKPEFDQVFPAEFWREVVDRVAAEAPNTLLLAEAFWLMEGYFVRTLGMHRVYNSAFMNMLKMEDNQKYRQTLKNVLEFSPAILQRFVNFMNNPDERTAVEQFGKGDKYFGCCLLLVTMPGLPMLGHGQVEGFSEKYGMEYRRAYWDEPIDSDLVARHDREIFPLMRRRHLFSGAENFALFDFESDGGWVDENVFVFTNRAGGDRALIIYNNAYEQTSGRVRQAAAKNIGSAEAPHLVRPSLGEALDLEAGPGVWYIFHDVISGLEYLRRGAELVHEGFFTHLGGYERRALIDFRRVHESEGPWAAIADHLQGGGTPNVMLARRRLELKAELGLVRRWAGSEVLAAVEPPQAAPVKKAAKKATKTASPKTPSIPAPALPADLPADLVASVARLRALPEMAVPATLGPAAAKDFADLLAGLSGSRIAQALYLRDLLHVVPGPWPTPTTPPAGLAGLGAGDLPLVLSEISDQLVDWSGHPFAGHSTADLAVLLAHCSTEAVAMTAGRAGWFPPLLSRPQARRSLGVNDHEGRTYLNREALEVFLDAMVLGALPDLTGDRPDPAAITGLLDARALINEAAAAAGYEVQGLIRRLAGGPR